MTLRIRTNVASLNAQRHLQATSHQVRTHTERLASGHRINKAADDAAGLAISEGLRADVRSLGQAKRNANDGVSLLQVAEGGLEEITNIVVRLRELAIQGASDTIGNRERDYLNREFMALKDEVDRISYATEFNGTRLLTGMSELPESMMADHSMPPFEIQVDKGYNLDTDSLEVANPIHVIRLDFTKVNAMTEGEGSLELGRSDNEDGTRVDTKAASQLTINRLDTAMQKVSDYRASLGAMQNRLESTNRNLSIKIESLESARSRIRDADFADEVSNLTQQNILYQAGASVLTQANQLPQIALQLLGQ
jgi:flagellin